METRPVLKHSRLGGQNSSEGWSTRLDERDDDGISQRATPCPVPLNPHLIPRFRNPDFWLESRGCFLTPLS